MREKLRSILDLGAEGCRDTSVGYTEVSVIRANCAKGMSQCYLAVVDRRHQVDPQ